MRYLLSKLIPVPMHSTYGTVLDGNPTIEAASWWQWRSRIWAHRRHPVTIPGTV